MVRRSRATAPALGAHAGVDDGGPTVPVDGAPADEDDAEEEPFLSPTIDDERVCGCSYALDTAFPIAAAYSLKTGHLSRAHGAFFRRWEHLLAHEEAITSRHRAELWTLPAAQREARGRAFGGMALAALEPGDGAAGAHKIHHATHRLVRAAGAVVAGDAVVVSLDAPALDASTLALARGLVLALVPRGLLLGIDHALDARRAHGAADLRFRVNNDELLASMAQVRGSLAQRFHPCGTTRLRALVVDLAPPGLDAESAPVSEEAADAATLNAEQRVVMRAVPTARNYAPVLGMPGTGKTTPIAAMIRALVRVGRTVLLASYTHSAVDTMLLLRRCCQRR